MIMMTIKGIIIKFPNLPRLWPQIKSHLPITIGLEKAV